MKTCFKCNLQKSLEEFYAHKQMSDGYLSKCKSCTKIDVKENRKNKYQFYKEYDQFRGSRRGVSFRRIHLGTKDGEKRKYTYAEVTYKSWKGSKDEYRALHYWVQGELGKPDTCTQCKRTGLSGRKIHWANISGEYRKDLRDWVRLCAKCHMKYDRRYPIRIK